MKDQRVEHPDRPRPKATKAAKKPLVRRERVSVHTRRQIIDAVMEGRCNGAEAARTYSVSEATVHRLIKAEHLANPLRVMVPRIRTALSVPTRRVADEAAPDVARQRHRALNTAQKREVVERFYRGSDLPTDLAREFGVHKSTISRVLQTARALYPSRPIPEFDKVERQRRVNEGVAKAVTSGRKPGSKPKLSVEAQEAIVIEADTAGTSVTSVARRHGVSPSMVGRLVRASRIHSGPDSSQSLDEIFSDLMRK